jgi:hypothetical protein
VELRPADAPKQNSKAKANRSIFVLFIPGSSLGMVVSHARRRGCESTVKAGLRQTGVITGGGTKDTPDWYLTKAPSCRAFLIARVPRLRKTASAAEILMSAHCLLSPAATLAFISRLLSLVLANLSPALVRDRLANVFSQIVSIFAAILTVIPGA